MERKKRPRRPWYAESHSGTCRRWRWFGGALHLLLPAGEEGLDGMNVSRPVARMALARDTSD